MPRKGNKIGLLLVSLISAKDFHYYFNLFKIFLHTKWFQLGIGKTISKTTILAAAFFIFGIFHRSYFCGTHYLIKPFISIAKSHIFYSLLMDTILPDLEKTIFPFLLKHMEDQRSRFRVCCQLCLHFTNPFCYPNVLLILKALRIVYMYLCLLAIQMFC